MNNRPFIFFLILASVLLGPYWLYLPLMVIALILIPLWWEGVLLGFIIDTIYGASTVGLWGLSYPTALFASIIITLTPLAREKLRLYV